jgi:hypothetical protein
MKSFPYPEQKEFKIFKKLTSPAKIQSFVNALPINFEPNGETVHSPLTVLRRHSAHCLEGALLAAAIFWFRGEPPLLLDLESTEEDESHSLALFKRGGAWGAVSKTNHAVLRFRDPIYKTIRELVLSYFHEYYRANGKKTLRRYSKPLSLLRFKPDWLISDDDLWFIDAALDTAAHLPIVNARQAATLRPIDSLERKAGRLVEWPKQKK